eukprot:1160951-Pelagomonas_calceolata.AAC.7
MYQLAAEWAADSRRPCTGLDSRTWAEGGFKSADTSALHGMMYRSVSKLLMMTERFKAPHDDCLEGGFKSADTSALHGMMYRSVSKLLMMTLLHLLTSHVLGRSNGGEPYQGYIESCDLG